MTSCCCRFVGRSPSTNARSSARWMRRGRLTHLRAGQLLPWSRAPFSYQLDPDHPRDPACLHLDPAAAALVQEMFAWYLEPGATVHSIALRLTRAGMPT